MEESFQGIPQGLKLCLLKLLTYINDLLQNVGLATKSTKGVLFADDTILLVIGKNNRNWALSAALAMSVIGSVEIIWNET